MLNHWELFLTVLMGPTVGHSPVYYIRILVNSAEDFSARLQYQYRYQPMMTESLVRLI